MVSSVRYTAYGVAVDLDYVEEHQYDVCHWCGKCHSHDYPFSKPFGVHKGRYPSYSKNWIKSFPSVEGFSCPHSGCYIEPKSKSGVTQHMNAVHGGWAVFPHSGPNQKKDSTPFSLPIIDLTQHGFDAETVSSMNKALSGQTPRDWTPVLGSPDFPSRIASIYIAADLVLDYPELKPLLDTHVSEMMHHILNYLVISTTGEARYFGTLVQEKLYTEAVPSLLAPLKPLTQWLAASLPTNQTAGRMQVWQQGLSLAQIVGAEALLLSLEELFSLPLWTGKSVGGDSWARVAAHGVKFLKGEESPMLALDSIIDIVHNNGWALNKYYSQEDRCDNHSIALSAILNQKHDNALRLLTLVCVQPWLQEALVEQGIIYRLYEYLPNADKIKNYTCSEVAARSNLILPPPKESSRFAAIESVEGFWLTHVRGFVSWLNLFGEPPYSASSIGLAIWQNLIAQNDRSPTYAQWRQWNDLVRGSAIRLRSVVEAIQQGFSPEEAEEQFGAEESQAQPLFQNKKTVVFNEPATSVATTVPEHPVFVNTQESSSVVLLEGFASSRAELQPA